MGILIILKVKALTSKAREFEQLQNNVDGNFKVIKAPTKIFVIPDRPKVLILPKSCLYHVHDNKHLLTWSSSMCLVLSWHYRVVTFNLTSRGAPLCVIYNYDFICIISKITNRTNHAVLQFYSI